MKHYLPIILWCLLVAVIRAEEPWWKVFGEIKVGNFAGGHHDGEDKLDKETEALLKMTKFNEWETYEDDLVKLSYPKHELLKLKVKGGEDGISVEGGVCTTVDNSFQRAYVLMAGPATYAVFLVAQADWLDDGICMCGPMVHHAYRMQDGCLVRYSLLPGGAVKKAQKLGGKLRLMSFEWTHLACQREVYEQMVERMTLKIAHLWTEARLQDEVAKRYGMDGRCGWLHPGTPLAEANRIMGAEAQLTNGIHQWKGILNDYQCELTAEFKDGRMVKLTNEGLHRTGEDAVKGSIHWAEDRIEALTKNLSDPDKPVTPPTPAQLAEVADAVVALADSTPADDWWQIQNLIDQLTDTGGARDPRLVAAITKHGCGSPTEHAILKRCGYQEINRWVVEKLTAMRAEKPSTVGAVNMFSDPVSQRGSDAAELLGELAQFDQAAAASHAQALFETDEPAWTLAVLLALDYFENAPLPPQRLAADGLARARKAHSPEMAAAALRLIKHAADMLTDRAAVETMINDLPKADSDSDWETDKKEALEALKSATKSPKKDQ